MHERRVEPLLESVARLEDAGQQEVEQRPQFGQLVLQRRAGKQEPVRRDVRAVEHLSEFAVVVLHAVALVDHHVLPADLPERRLVLYDEVVRRKQHVEAARLERRRLQRAARVRAASVHHLNDGGRPPVELEHPVREGRQRHDDQERTVHALLLHQVGDQSDSLNRLAETHLVGENAVQVVVVQRHEPLEAFELSFTRKIQDSKVHYIEVKLHS